ncbi:MAG: glycerol-3-phosphate dehydrogenase, partial [Gammaproteobacteria bacterium]|nr:glycerol-3-phosphate dehydrogenase [Gammaproteobacteria bacterium]
MSSEKQKTIVVLGAGSWGTALALLHARNGYASLLWGNDPSGLARLERDRQNKFYLPDITFPANLRLIASLDEAAESSSRFLVAVPSHAFRATVTALLPHLSDGSILAWATKGLEPGSGKLLS